MAKVGISMGTNVGDRMVNLSAAVALVGAALPLLGVSAAYETAPMYVTDQPPFLNAAMIAEAEIGPREVLALLKSVESRVGRQPGLRYGPRVLDLDLITYGSLIYRFEVDGHMPVIVPHPDVAARRFVLEPLAEISPDLDIPGHGRVADLLRTREVQLQQAGVRFHSALRPLTPT